MRYLIVLLIALGVMAWADFVNAEEPLHHPVWVIVFWLHPLDGKDTVDIDSVEIGGEAPSPDICATLPMNEVLKPVEDAAEKIEKGLTPVVVCGIAAPVQQADEEQPKKRSNPGHGDWDHSPSDGV